MKRILTLTPKDFLTGFATDAYKQDSGLWIAATGINTFLDPEQGSASLGLLAAAPTPVDMTGSTIVDTPWAWDADLTGSTTYLYLWGDDGNLYKLTLTDNTLSNVAIGAAVSNAAAGIFIVKHSDGTTKLYYWQTTQLGQWQTDQAWATRTNNYATSGIQSTTYKPTHRLFDRWYFCNGRYIGEAHDNGSGGLTITATALDFEASFRATALSDDGTYLVAGITRTTGSVSFAGGQSKIIFWDTNQSSWQREWNLPDATILAIKRRPDGWMEAITPTQIYVFSISQPPQPMRAALTIGTNTPNTSLPAHYAADRWGGAALWGGSARLVSFGKVVPQAPNAYHEPFAGFTGNVSLVCSSVHTSNIFVGTSSDKLYRVSALGAATSVSASAQSFSFDLGRWWQIRKVVTELATLNGGSYTISVAPRPGNQVALPAVTAAVSRSEQYITSRCDGRHVFLQASINSSVNSSPAIKRIELWGDPIEPPAYG